MEFPDTPAPGRYRFTVADMKEDKEFIIMIESGTSGEILTLAVSYETGTKAAALQQVMAMRKVFHDAGNRMGSAVSTLLEKPCS